MAMDMLLTIRMSVQVRILLHHHLPIMAMHLITHTTIITIHTGTGIILRMDTDTGVHMVMGTGTDI